MTRLLRSACLLLVTLIGFVYAQACPSDHYIWPTTGSGGSPIGMRTHPITGNQKMHEGLDIGAPGGTPVYAAADGVAGSADHGGSGYGKHVWLTHKNGTVSLYAHLSQINVSSGQTIKQGAKIGEVGSTGGSTGNHLHYELSNSLYGPPLRINGQYWDAAAGGPGAPLSANSCMKMAAGPGGAIPGAQDTPNNGTTTGPSAAPQMSDADIAAEAARRCDKWFAWPPWKSQEEKKADCIKDETEKINKALEEAVKAGQIPTGIPKELRLENVFPTPEVWLDETNKLLDKNNIPKHLLDLGTALLFAGFVYSLVSVMRAHASDQLFLLFGRLIIAGGLILAAPNIRSGSSWIWTGAYDVMKVNVVKPATDDLQKTLDELYPLLASLVSISVAGDFIGGLAKNIPVVGGTLSTLASSSAGIATQSANGLLGAMVMLSALYAVYFFAIYASGMIMILVGILVPVLLAFLVIPGMASWFSRWFAMGFTSLLMVLAFPILFSVVVTLGVNKPMENVNKQLEPVQQSAKDLVQTLNTAPDLNIMNVLPMGVWVTTALTQTTAVAWKLIWIAVPLTLSIILLIISVVACMYLMQQLPSLLAGFTGGAAGTAARIDSAAFSAGLAASAGVASNALGAGVSSGIKTAGGVAKKGIDKLVTNAQKPASPGGSRGALPAPAKSSGGGGSESGGGSPKPQRGNGNKQSKEKESA
jgi:Peptidase family M23